MVSNVEKHDHLFRVFEVMLFLPLTTYPLPLNKGLIMLKSILGTKVGMTRIFDTQGNIVPVTVIECGPCVVASIRTKEKDGYNEGERAEGYNLYRGKVLKLLEGK